MLSFSQFTEAFNIPFGAQASIGWMGVDGKEHHGQEGEEHHNVARRVFHTDVATLTNSGAVAFGMMSGDLTEDGEIEFFVSFNPKSKIAARHALLLMQRYGKNAHNLTVDLEHYNITGKEFDKLCNDLMTGKIKPKNAPKSLENSGGLTSHSLSEIAAFIRKYL